MSLTDFLLDRAVWFVPVLLSLTVHEWAHAWTAWMLGDDTAKMLGRVSLNPVDHIDPVGTLLLPLLGVPFGWAKPVPVNPVRFRASISMPMGVLLTAAAGPASNVILAAGSCGVLLAMNSPLVYGLDPELHVAASEFLQYLVLINLVLALFNLLPIPPLDGSRIVDAVVPARLRTAWNRLCSLGPALLATLILLPSLLGYSVLSRPVAWISGLLLEITQR